MIATLFRTSGAGLNWVVSALNRIKPETGRLVGAVGVLLLILVFWAGCGSPEQRYRVLSFFFDGVPDPSALSALPASGYGLPQLTGAIVSVHEPYRLKQCSECHKEQSVDSSFAYSSYVRLGSDICIGCHEDLTEGYTRVHGAVAAQACMWCHMPHESRLPNLLRATSPAICFQCHDPDLLLPDPPEHLDPEAPCLECHYGHGGDDLSFLRETYEASPPQEKSDAPILSPDQIEESNGTEIDQSTPKRDEP